MTKCHKKYNAVWLLCARAALKSKVAVDEVERLFSGIFRTLLQEEKLEEREIINNISLVRSVPGRGGGRRRNRIQFFRNGDCKKHRKSDQFEVLF